MAYMRGEPYIYPTNAGDEEGVMVHASGSSVFLALDSLQELAVMVLAKLNEDEYEQVVMRTLEKHGSNFGSDALQRRLGLPTAMDFVVALAEQIQQQNPHLAQGGFPPSDTGTPKER